MKVNFLLEEKESVRDIISSNTNIEPVFTSVQDIKNIKCEFLYINSRYNANFLIKDIRFVLYETPNIDFLVIEKVELLNFLVNNVDNILDTKLDSSRSSWDIYKFFRVGDKKLYKVIAGFRNYYYVKDENGEYDAFGGFKCRKETNYKLDINIENAYERDLSAVKRYSVDNYKRWKLNGKYRKCYFDIETNACVDAVRTPGEVLSIVTQDSLTGEVKEWIIAPDNYKNKSVEELKDWVTNTPADVVKKLEINMLTDFMSYVREFDILTGWNVMKFDIPYVINRAKLLGVDTSIMSKCGMPCETWHKPEDTINPWFIVVCGLNLIDMMTASVRSLAYLDEKLKDNKLDTVAEVILGETKMHTDTPAILFKNGRLKELMDYNIQDVLLLMKLDEKLGLIDLLKATIEIIPGINIEECAYNSKIIDFDLLCNSPVKLPTVNKDKVTDIKGATVLDPVSGIWDYVAIADISGMYPNLIKTFNISPDTIITQPEEGCTNIHGTIFSTKKVGILPQMVDKYTKLRKQMKKLKEQAEKDGDTEAYNLYKLREFGTKKIITSLYGVFGYIGFRLFDNRIANAITGSGRDLLLWMAEFAKSRGYTVVTGDTDSIFIRYNGSEKDQEIIDNIFKEFIKDMNSELHNYVKKFTNNKQVIDKHTLLIEYETLFNRVIITPAKKKYIGKVTLVKGKKLKTPQLYFKGSELNKKDVPRGFKNIIHKMVNDILDNDGSRDNIEILREYVLTSEKIVKSMEIKDLLIYKEINRDFNEYSVQPQHVRSAIASNLYLGADFSRQNYKGGILYVKSSKYPEVDALFMNDEMKLTKDFIPDYDQYIEKFVTNKIQLIFGDDIFYMVIRDPAQKGLTAWVTK